MKLGLSLTVNGDRKQASSTERMIFSVFEQIEYLSRVATLRAGDVIITGTPAGTGIASGAYLNPGDRVVAEVESVGRLETTIVESR
jgi:2-keto-4-pentenoate hydratase/2-oxohepta-3-ene-1,7-dioic acid hydratase in catechol pathway